MTVTGDTFTTYANTVWIPRVETTVFHNDSLLGGQVFPVVPPASCPGGDYINIGIDYAVSTNAAAYTLGDAMPSPDSISTVRAYFNKDLYQVSAKTYDYYKYAYETNYNGKTIPFSQDTKAIDMAGKNLRDLITTTMLSDLATWVDATNNFSDAALARGTYTSLVSYEPSGATTYDLADLDDALEALEDVTYGPVPRSSLIWLMDRTNFTDICNLCGRASNLQLDASSQNMGKIDADMTMRVGSYGGVPIYVVPDASSSYFFLLNREKIKIYNWAPVVITPKDVAEAAQSWLITMGATLVVENPREQGKIAK